jgi:hypothetical protein
MRRTVRLALLFAGLAIGGCASQERLTADAVGCGVMKVTIVPSVYQRRGTETAWCAVCEGKRYQCVTNADRTRTECRESREGDGCL